MCGQLHSARPAQETRKAVALQEAALSAIEAGKARQTIPLELALCSVRSLWNVGSIFRTAEGLGISHIHLLGFTPTPENPRLARTALGAERVVPWTHYPDLVSGLELIQSRAQLIALERGQGARSLEEVQLTPPTCLLLGNEVVGLDEEVLARTDHWAEISMYGAKASLNVAVAAGIACHTLGDRVRFQGTERSGACLVP